GYGSLTYINESSKGQVLELNENDLRFINDSVIENLRDFTEVEDKNSRLLFDTLPLDDSLI
ncbi:unnamed protein product, partial [marine sediment metagenome]